MLNPNLEWFSIGIARKNTKDHRNTFYGVSRTSQWWLNGKWTDSLKGRKGGRIKKRINMQHFKSLKDGEIDIYVNLEVGELKMCIVGDCNEDKEVVINGINEAEQDYGIGNDPWVPRLSLSSSSRSIKVRICKIDPECYGQEIKIDWS